MRGMDAVIAIRHRGVQPACVMVELVDTVDAGQPSISHSGIVTVQITLADSIGDLDLRPLVGLHVQVFDYTETPARHVRLCALIADIKPRILVMHQTDDDGEYTAHVLSDGKTQTITTRRSAA
jgi:hypothetical protein